MKMFSSLKILLVMLLLSVIIAGCVHKTRITTLDYFKYNSKTISPLSTKGIKVCINSFEDAGLNQINIGYMLNGYMEKCGSVVPKNSVTKWITDAMKLEFKHAGFKIECSENINNEIFGKILKLICIGAINYEGSIELLISHYKDDSIVFSKVYSAEVDGGINWAATEKGFSNTFKILLRKVLIDVVYDIDRLLEKSNSNSDHSKKQTDAKFFSNSQDIKINTNLKQDNISNQNVNEKLCKQMYEPMVFCNYNGRNIVNDVKKHYNCENYSKDFSKPVNNYLSYYGTMYEKMCNDVCLDSSYGDLLLYDNFKNKYCTELPKIELMTNNNTNQKVDEFKYSTGLETGAEVIDLPPLPRFYCYYCPFTGKIELRYSDE